ncbi:hypothetical protein PCE1_000686 [Barthelona sp. PCE]
MEIEESLHKDARKRSAEQTKEMNNRDPTPPKAQCTVIGESKEEEQEKCRKANEIMRARIEPPEILQPLAGFSFSGAGFRNTILGLTQSIPMPNYLKISFSQLIRSMAVIVSKTPLSGFNEDVFPHQYTLRDPPLHALGSYDRSRGRIELSSDSNSYEMHFLEPIIPFLYPTDYYTASKIPLPSYGPPTVAVTAPTENVLEFTNWNVQDPRLFVSIDCEMVGTSGADRCVRIAAVDVFPTLSLLFKKQCEMYPRGSSDRHPEDNGELENALMDLMQGKFPNEPCQLLWDVIVSLDDIVEIRTQYTGLTLDDVAKFGVPHEEMLSVMQRYVHPLSIICGHSVFNDLLSLNMSHGFILDVTEMINGTIWSVTRSVHSLKGMSKKYVKRSVQGCTKYPALLKTVEESEFMSIGENVPFVDLDNGHCPIEDALAVALVLRKVFKSQKTTKDLKFLKRIFKKNFWVGSKRFVSRFEHNSGGQPQYEIIETETERMQRVSDLLDERFGKKSGMKQVVFTEMDNFSAEDLQGLRSTTNCVLYVMIDVEKKCIMHISHSDSVERLKTEINEAKEEELSQTDQ